MSNEEIKTSRWVKITLAVSLTLNLIVLGLAGGAVLKGRALNDARPDPDGMSIVTRALPERFEANVRREVRQRHEEIRASREALYALRRDLAEVLTAEPFDIDAVEDIFAQQRAILIDLTGSGQDLVIQQIATMNEAERAKYAENLLRPRRDGREQAHR